MPVPVFGYCPLANLTKSHQNNSLVDELVIHVPHRIWIDEDSLAVGRLPRRKSAASDCDATSSTSLAPVSAAAADAEDVLTSSAVCAASLINVVSSTCSPTL